MPLVNEALCRAAAPIARVNHVDEKTPGFILRVTPNGARSFWFYYRDRAAKKPVWVKLGDYHQQAFNAEAARVAAIGMLAKVSGPTQVDLRKEKQRAAQAAIAGGKTFGEVVELYLDDCRTRLRATRVIETNLQRPLAAWGKLPCNEVTARMIADMLRPLAKVHHSAAKHIQTNLHTFFKWAFQPGREHVAFNPLAGIERFAKGDKSKPKINLTEAEIRTLWFGLDDPEIRAAAKCRRSDALAIKLTLCTMLRSGEAVKAARGELGHDHGPIITIPASRVKKDRDIAQPLNSLAQEIVTEALADPDAAVMFPGDCADGMAAQKTLAHILAGTKGNPGLCKLLGIRRFTPHQLRHTASTLVNRECSNVPNIQTHVEYTLDHLDASSIGKVYNCHKYLAEKRQVLNLLDIELRRILAGLPARSETEGVVLKLAA